MKYRLCTPAHCTAPSYDFGVFIRPGGVSWCRLLPTRLEARAYRMSVRRSVSVNGSQDCITSEYSLSRHDSGMPRVSTSSWSAYVPGTTRQLCRIRRPELSRSVKVIPRVAPRASALSDTA
jgi:hypothetical protein